MKKAIVQYFLIIGFALSTGGVYADAAAKKPEPITGPDMAENEDLRQAVSYISLRNKIGEDSADEWYGDERNVVRTGKCTLVHTPITLPESLSRNGLVYVPDTLIDLESIVEVEESEFWQDLKSTNRGQRPILYLHGYNMSFARGCKQASLFQTNLNLGRRLILFSWPSDGALLNYARDEADLIWSIAPLESLIEKMVLQFGAGGFDVVAHSLGARGLFFALVQLGHGQHASLPLVNQLVLTAPDIDAGIAAQYLTGIRPLAKNISLYVSSNDRPLALSQDVHGYPRLGEDGPHLDEIAGVEIIDVSAIAVRSFSGHLYHLYHEKVQQDLDQLLNKGLPAQSRTDLQKEGMNRWSIN